MISTEPVRAATSSDGERMGTATAPLDIYSLPYKREFQVEGGTFSRPAVHLDLAGVLLDDAVRHRQSQSGAAPLPIAHCGLGGEKRVVDPIHVFGRDAAAGIAHRNAHAITILRAHGQ